MAYGVTESGVANNLGISKKEAEELIESYIQVNPEMRDYMNNQHRMARDKGYITNPFGAFLSMPDVHKENLGKLNYKDKQIIEKQKKKSLNYPIQSSNAFLLYEGLIEADKRIKEKSWEDKFHFLFSVYDSFCYEVHDSLPEEEVLDLLERSFCCMLGELPLKLDYEKGTSWGSTEKIERKTKEKIVYKKYDMGMT